MEMVTSFGLQMGQLGMWVEVKKNRGCVIVTSRSCLERQWEERVANTVDYFSVVFPARASVSATWYPFYSAGQRMKHMKHFNFSLHISH